MSELVDGTSSSTEPARGIVLVALPAADDPVHGIGPEEKHVTLVYLGKTDNLPLNDQGVPWYIFDDVKDAVTRWLADPSTGGPLSENFSAATIAGVSSLGEESARVWLFDSPRLVALHDALLTIQTVKNLAGKADQFPSYLPHTTIGYPTEGRTSLDPATEAVASAVDAVAFDRLALWWGDHRVEWPLTLRGGSMTEQDWLNRALEFSDRRSEAGMAPSDVLSNFMNHAVSAQKEKPEAIGSKKSESSIGYALRHAGILGMKWGVRRSKGPDGTVTSAVAKSGGAKDSGTKESVPNTAADGVRARATLKAVQRKGIASISDADLQHLTKRLQLEKQFSDVDKSVVGKLDTKVNKLLKYGDTMNRAIKIANSDSGRLLSQILRGSNTGSRGQADLAKGIKTPGRHALDTPGFLPKR